MTTKKIINSLEDITDQKYFWTWLNKQKILFCQKTLFVNIRIRLIGEEFLEIKSCQKTLSESLKIKLKRRIYYFIIKNERSEKMDMDIFYIIGIVVDALNQKFIIVYPDENTDSDITTDEQIVITDDQYRALLDFIKTYNIPLDQPIKVSLTTRVNENVKDWCNIARLDAAEIIFLTGDKI